MLHDELRERGIHVAHTAIGGRIAPGGDHEPADVAEILGAITPNGALPDPPRHRELGWRQWQCPNGLKNVSSPNGVLTVAAQRTQRPGALR